MLYADIKKGKQIMRGLYVANLYINGFCVYKFSNGDYYKRIDDHPISYTGPGYEVYEVNGKTYLVFTASNHKTVIERMKMIKSKLNKPFTGFAPDKEYHLENGQLWQQVDGPEVTFKKSPGNVRILDESILMVDNWSYFPIIKQIEPPKKKSFWSIIFGSPKKKD